MQAFIRGYQQKNRFLEERKLVVITQAAAMRELEIQVEEFVQGKTKLTQDIFDVEMDSVYNEQEVNMINIFVTERVATKPEAGS